MLDASQSRLFRYRALDQVGNTATGELRASTAADAARSLLRQGLHPVEVTAASLPQGLNRASTSTSRQGAIGAVEREIALRELGTLLKSGVPLDEALESLVAGHNGSRLGMALASALTGIRAGESLHEALGRSGLGLQEHLLTLVRVGEASGHLAAALLDASTQLEAARRARAELRAALTYPAILILAGVVAILIVFIGVIPRFAPLLNSSRGDVPDFSVWTIQAAVFLKQHILWLGVGVTAATISMVALFSQPEAKRVLLNRAALLPLIGPWLRASEVGRWSALMGAMLSNRVPLLEALALSHGTLGLSDFRAMIASAARGIREGQTLHQCLANSDWIPPARLNLIKVGERSGTLDAMLTSLGALQLEAARERQKQVMSLIEPVAIIVIGLVIGVLMVSVMMAITSMNGVGA